MDKIDKSQYKNLRSSFQYLVNHVLGHDYYNTCADVYSSDKECVSAMIRKFDKLSDKVTFYKVLSAIFAVSTVVMTIVSLI